MIRLLLFSVFLLFVQPALAGGNTPFDIRGQLLTSGDRPLLISTYEQIYKMFKYSLSMQLKDNEIGFINAAVTDLFHFTQDGPLNHSFNASAEEEAIYSTQHMLALLSSVGQPLEFNGRVILDIHGGGGVFSFEFHGSMVSFSPEQYGEILGRFFLKNRIKIKMIDILSCGVEETIKEFFDGLLRSGLTNFELRGVMSERIEVPDDAVSRDNDTVDIHTKTGEQNTFINTADYFVRGDLSGVPEDMVLSLVHGVPETVIPPGVVPVQPSCQN